MKKYNKNKQFIKINLADILFILDPTKLEYKQTICDNDNCLLSFFSIFACLSLYHDLIKLLLFILSNNIVFTCFFGGVIFILLWFDGVTEVRSKILTPLETTGGNSFSLEGFEKMLVIIQNFAQGDLQSTGGIQISFLGVYNSTGGIQLSFQGVYNSTGGIQISFPGGLQFHWRNSVILPRGL